MKRFMLDEEKIITILKRVGIVCIFIESILLIAIVIMKLNSVEVFSWMKDTFVLVAFLGISVFLIQAVLYSLKRK